MSEKLLRANEVDLCVETFGDPGDAAVLLVGGVCSSMDWWATGLCESLARAGRFVIRYDHRDTGRSVSYPPGAPGYTFDDLVADAAGVLAALGVDRAHVVGMSMGGAIAQLLALRHPARVAALTLLCTATVVAPPGGSGDSDEKTDEPNPAWLARDTAVDALVEDQRSVAAPSRRFDEAAARALAETVVDRTVNIESSMRNHWLAGSGDPAGWPTSLAGITAPTTVLRGDEDPMFGESAALELAESIPGARLIVLARNGHELTPENWPVLRGAVLG